MKQRKHINHLIKEVLNEFKIQYKDLRKDYPNLKKKRDRIKLKQPKGDINSIMIIIIYY